MYKLKVTLSTMGIRTRRLQTSNNRDFISHANREQWKTWISTAIAFPWPTGRFCEEYKTAVFKHMSCLLVWIRQRTSSGWLFKSKSDVYLLHLTLSLVVLILLTTGVPWNQTREYSRRICAASLTSSHTNARRSLIDCQPVCVGSPSTLVMDTLSLYFYPVYTVKLVLYPAYLSLGTKGIKKTKTAIINW